MVSYCNSYFDLVQTQAQMENNQYVENAINKQKPASSTSSSSPENIDQNGKVLCTNNITNNTLRENDRLDRNNGNPFGEQKSENTIEEFLVKAGGINPRPLRAIDPTVVVSHHDDWFTYQMQQQQQQQKMTMKMPMPLQTVVDSNFQVCDMGIEEMDQALENKLVDLPMTMSSLLAPVSSSHHVDSVERKVSFTEEMMEKSVERRRKRMIKNRESAARSRARKQAYTNQLEHDVLQLKKTNTLLKKRKEALKRLSEHSLSQPRFQLRRISSTSF